VSKKDTITVYWYPFESGNKDQSNLISYAQPTSLKAYVNSKSKVSPFGMRSCPAFRDVMSNVFVIRSTVDDEFEIPMDQVNAINSQEVFSTKALDIPNSKISMQIERKPEYDGYYNISYGLAWLFFADEPVVARITSPWFPPSSPIPRSMLATGEFDIGQWLRSINTEYLVPNSENKFSIKKDDPILYIELFTDKKIIFKRFVLSEKLRELLKSRKKNVRFKKLADFYAMARNAKRPELILSEIKRNLTKEQ
jgi:hypothetical protein